MLQNRDSQAETAAAAYYLQNQTMAAISRQMGVSRSTVSRLLAHARTAGIVQISLHATAAGAGGVAAKLESEFGVRVRVVNTASQPSAASASLAVAAAAAQLVSATVLDGGTLGIAWGNTTAEVVAHLPRVERTGVRVVQLNGALSEASSGVPHGSQIVARAAAAFSGREVHFPVPAFFDYPETRSAMWREKSVRSVLKVQRQCDVALFGVGSMDAEISSWVYTQHYLAPRQLRALREEKVVGDICTVFLRADGSYLDIPLNQQASGPSPAQLHRIARRICVVSDKSKLPALVAALRAKVATDLVIDTETARALLDKCTKMSGMI